MQNAPAFYVSIYEFVDEFKRKSSAVKKQLHGNCQVNNQIEECFASYTRYKYFALDKILLLNLGQKILQVLLL